MKLASYRLFEADWGREPFELANSQTDLVPRSMLSDLKKHPKFGGLSNMASMTINSTEWAERDTAFLVFNPDAIS